MALHVFWTKAEMAEFTGSTEDTMASLPDNSSRPSYIASPCWVKKLTKKALINRKHCRDETRTLINRRNADKPTH